MWVAFEWSCMHVSCSTFAAASCIVSTTMTYPSCTAVRLCLQQRCAPWQNWWETPAPTVNFKPRKFLNAVNSFSVMKTLACQPGAACCSLWTASACKCHACSGAQDEAGAHHSLLHVWVAKLRLGAKSLQGMLLWRTAVLSLA